MVALQVEPVLEDPCPRAGVTVTGLSVGDHVVTVWRTADGERLAVRGARTLAVNDSFYVEDFEVPLGRPVTYALEVLSGPDAGVSGVSEDALVESDTGYVQDPLDPSSAVPVRAGGGGDSRTLLAGSFSGFSYEAPTSTFNVMGSRFPVAISGTRQAASGVPFSVLTESKAENVRMRELVQQAPLLLIRGLPSWGSRVPAVATYSAGSVTESAVLPGDDGATIWETTGDVVRGSSARVLIALWTYQDVAEIFATYDQKQASAGSGTYLDDQKNPSG